MNKSIRIIVLIIICVLGGSMLGWVLNNRFKIKSNGFIKAIETAQKLVDCKYGNGTFIVGLRRVLKDGEKEYYSFHVKVHDPSITNTMNLLVNVDNISDQNKVFIQMIENDFFKVD